MKTLARSHALGWLQGLSLLLLLPAGAAAATAPASPPAPPTAPVSPQAQAAAPNAGQPAAPPQADLPSGMTTYYFVLLRRGPEWKPGSSPEVEKLLEGHMANIQRLSAAGKLLLAGPFLQQSGPGSWVGLFVLQAASPDEAKELVATDPAVQAGRFVAEIYPWLGPKSLQTLPAVAHGK